MQDDKLAQSCYIINALKKAHFKFLKTHNVIIAAFLSLLGFASSCEKINPDIQVEYGSPSAKFIINGKIESADSNKPIENIRVIIQRDTAMSDSEGKYQVINTWSFPTAQSFNIKFQDIDGISNGEYQNLDTIVEFKNPQFKNGDGHWYSGEATTDFNVKLKPKK